MTAVAGVHVPFPSQDDPLTVWFCVESHDPPPQLVPFGHSAQCPCPSQLPFWPQVVAALAWQAGWGAVAFVPCVTGEQVPVSCPRLHCSQLPVQAALQHTPSAQ